MATAAVTGTVTNPTNEASVVAGGKTIIVTLTGDTWIAAGGAFSPSDISGLQLWLKSDTGITYGTAPAVSAWADQSGNGRNVSQSTASTQPAEVANQLNGYAAISFLSNDEMHTASWTQAQPIDVYLVIKQVTWAANQSVINSNAGNTILSTVSPTPNIRAYAGGSWYTANTGLTIGAYKTLQWRLNGASSYTRINGGSTVAGDGTSGFSGAFSLHQGTGNANDLVEVIIYDSALSDTNRGLVETYLKDKYAHY